MKEIKSKQRKTVKIADAQISFSQIKQGDIIRLYEPDGSPVRDDDGKVYFEAEEDAYLDKETGEFCFKIGKSHKTRPPLVLKKTTFVS